MTRRDLIWRAGGLASFAAAVLIGPAELFGTSNATGLVACCLAFVGAILIIQGKRIPAAIRIERGRHPTLPQAVREQHWRSRSKASADVRDRRTGA